MIWYLKLIKNSKSQIKSKAKRVQQSKSEAIWILTGETEFNSKAHLTKHILH